MSLLTDRLAERRKVLVAPRISCQTCKWLNTLTAQERTKINEWLADGLSSRALWEELHESGLPVRVSAFRNHLRDCAAK